MTIYEIVLFLAVGFIAVFCVFITMALQMTNKELERTQKTVEKQGMLMKYERLTKQNWHNAKFSINTEANNRIFLHRLWELENRIENFGTLPDKRDYNRITDRRDSPLVMSQWAGSPDDLAVYNRLWELENRIEQEC